MDQIAAVPVYNPDYDYAGETQGATQQASQAFYQSDVHAKDRPFFGCLQPCNTSLRRIDFVKTNSVVAIGRGANNDFIMSGMRISFNHCRITWDGCENAQSQVIVHDNSTNGTWINGSRILKGHSRILRDGNEIAFGSPMPQQNSSEDYRYIYRHLAPYELTGIHAFYDMAHELGRGTFATVMKAMSRSTSEWFAVKIIHSQKFLGTNTGVNNNDNNAAARQNSNHLQKLGREISILEKLDHPNVCRLRETFVPEDGGHDFYLVLELIEGGDLLDFILSHNGLSEPMSRHITSQICSALSHIHEKGITHRDLKPENILLTKDDPPIVKVADFGLAKVVDSLTMLRTMCGTPNYLAPEVVMEGVRMKGYDQLVDSWSVGVIVFSMLTNIGPFIEDAGEPDIQRRIAGRQITWDILQEMGISTTAQEFIRRLLDVNPATRMSLTDALNHPWLSRSAPSGSGNGSGGAGQGSTTTQHGLGLTLSDVSELSELPEDDERAGVNGDASMLSAAPSTDAILDVRALQINSSQRARQPLERRSKVLARELVAEAEAQAATSGAAASSSPTGGAKRQRSETDNTGSPAVDMAVTGGESGGDSDGGAAMAMDVVEAQPRAAKRGRRIQDRQSASPPTAAGNGSDNGDNGQGRVLRSRVAAAAGGHR